MKSPKFIGSKFGEKPQGFMDDMDKIFRMMHVTDFEGVEFVVYHLKYIAY